MTKTIGFFGDSYCAEARNHHSIWNKYETYLSKLAKYYNATIVNQGHGGTSVWDTLLLQLQPFIDSNTVPDICVFVWTIPGRLFHRKVRRLNRADTFNPKLHTFNPFKHKVWNAAKEYYTHLQDWEKEKIEYIAILRYIDQVVLAQLPATTKIIHLWATGNTPKGWSKEGVHPANIEYLHTWNTGTEIRPSLVTLSLYDADISTLDSDHRANHLDGEFKNNLVAEWIKEAVNSPNGLLDFSTQVGKLYGTSLEADPRAT